MKLEAIYFNLIKKGIKIYEIRIFDEKRKKIKLQDIIEFINKDTDETIKVKVIELSYYNTIFEVINNTEVKNLFDKNVDKEEAVKIYNKIIHKEGNYETVSKKYGIVRFKIELLK